MFSSRVLPPSSPSLSPPALVVYLVGSLILSGGQVSETTSVKWSVAVPYPLFVMPAILLIALAAASVVLAAVSVATRGPGCEPRRRLVRPCRAGGCWSIRSVPCRAVPQGEAEAVQIQSVLTSLSNSRWATSPAVQQVVTTTQNALPGLGRQLVNSGVWGVCTANDIAGVFGCNPLAGWDPPIPILSSLRVS